MFSHPAWGGTANKAGAAAAARSPMIEYSPEPAARSWAREAADVSAASSPADMSRAVAAAVLGPLRAELSTQLSDTRAAMRAEIRGDLDALAPRLEASMLEMRAEMAALHRDVEALKEAAAPK